MIKDVGSHTEKLDSELIILINASAAGAQPSQMMCGWITIIVIFAPVSSLLLPPLMDRKL
jgi:hypothetical protein